ncbi:MAG: cell division protein FtsW [Alphaproteobacteria bacterium]|nr:cell division protein FtsW [Alphaproteobacteria bacterium]
MIALARTDKNVVAEWWWTIDRVQLAMLLALMGVGLLFLLAASPAVAMRLGQDPFYFVSRQVLFLLPAAAAMAALSLLSPKEVRRAALGLLAAGIVLLVLTLLIGPQLNGARRWLTLGALTVQPSEFVKPAFVVVSAWLLADARSAAGMPAVLSAVGLLALVGGLLILQPDFGQTLLLCVVWGAMFFVAGISMVFVVSLGAAVLGGLGVAYLTLPHVAERVARFLSSGDSDGTEQVDRALQAFEKGGFLGVGPGQGQVKFHVPDAHTDFIFSVIGEEFGALVCVLLVLLFSMIVLRGILRAASIGDGFSQLAATGLFAMFGLQALINMAVNLQLMPAKGMTLPFISYGGSSVVAIAITMGFALALTRRRPQPRVSVGVR